MVAQAAEGVAPMNAQPLQAEPTPFQRASAFVLAEEGGNKITDYPDDPGGLTHWGIALKFHPELTREQLIAMTREQAILIYRDSYWLPGSCFELPDPVCIAHMDACINLGVGGAAEVLQRAVHVTVDGGIGPITLAAVDSLPAINVAERVIDQRWFWYVQQARTDKTVASRLRGYRNRLNSLREECGLPVYLYTL